MRRAILLRHKKEAPGRCPGLTNTYYTLGREPSYRSELPLGRAGSAESPSSFRWLFTSRSA